MDLPGLDIAKVEQYRQMDFSKAPPIVIGGGHILDGYHRANVAKALGIPSIKAYVGVQDKQDMAKNLKKTNEGLEEEKRFNPLPDPWNPKNIDPRLMTTQEYLDLVNSKKEYHPSSAYDVSVKELNWVKKESYPQLLKRIKLNGLYFEFRIKSEELKYVKRDPQGNNIMKDEEGNIIYLSPEEIKLSGKTPAEYSIAVFDEDGDCVAKSGDEWGAMLIQVAGEYRGFGLGTILGQLARKFEPSKTSGGFTAAGEKNFVRAHRETVRKALETGFYNGLVRSGNISQSRVKEILSSVDLTQKPKQDTLNLSVSDPRDWLIMSGDDNGGFIIYDKKLKDFYKDNLYEWGERFILGLILVRINYYPGREPVGIVVRFGGDNKKFSKLLMTLAASFCKSENVKLAVDKEDMSLIDTNTYEISSEKDPWGYGRTMVSINHPIDFNVLSLPEKRFRKSFDKYDEFKNIVQELAESKFR
jgi:hypothetical protein